MRLTDKGELWLARAISYTAATAVVFFLLALLGLAGWIEGK